MATCRPSRYGPAAADGRARWRVEDADRLVGAAGDQRLAVGRELELEDGAAEAADVADRLAVVVGVPEADQVVLAAGGDCLPSGLKATV